MTSAQTVLFSGFNDKDDAVTPAMAQYIEIKNANPDCLIFYRMGDFYELFFEDAEIASRALGIALTKRGKMKGEDIPLAGVPVSAADDYLQKLIALGHRIAVCEQMEDPAEAKKRGHKAVVRRDVVRLVTPGTVTEEKLLDRSESSFLLSLTRIGSNEEAIYGLAWIDLSTGEFRVCETTFKNLGADLARISPKEILLSDTLYDDKDLRAVLDIKTALTPLPSALSDSTSAERRITSFFNIQTLESFGRFTRAELAAAGLILSYVERTQRGAKTSLSPPQRDERTQFLDIDPAARSNLELTRTLSGEKKGSLLFHIDCTHTAAGSRLLSQTLCAPLTDPELINHRLDAVEALIEDEPLRQRLRETFKRIPDMVRALSRLALNRAGPRDLGQMRDALSATEALKCLFDANSFSELPLIEEAAQNLSAPPASLQETLSAALKTDLPLYVRDSGFVSDNYSQELDELRAYRDDAQKLILDLQQNYMSQTGIKTLKIKHNNILGYFIETGAQFEDRLRSEPLNRTFIHRQTLASQSRFSTAELNDIQSRIFGAADKAQILEEKIFDDLRAQILKHETELKSASQAIATLDVLAALAELAAQQNWARPIVDNSLSFKIEGGRHLVVEAALREAHTAPFIANDCNLSDSTIWLLTGPNMAGKSTFLRQNAVIAILAQMGSFVPAKSAHIGVIDKLYSRVGAADDLARGRSTFMVEMVETAAILNQSTERSLVILDEIGRGTATFDGLSIAWATIEHLHEANKCRALFATHFHELTALEQKLVRLNTMTMQVKEWEGDVVFLHQIGAGVASGSYGLQVAKLAGLPAAVIARARDIFTELETQDRAPKAKKLADGLAAYETQAKPARKDPALALLETVDPDALTPKQALETLYKLKQAGKANI
ncbi:MAG: DNA mismatch repair protein MutS [Pseudomonadota bacterium]